MTRSIPPQSNAFMIVVRSRIQETSVTTDRIADVDACNGFIYTGNRGDINSQIRFSVPNTTPITDRAGDLSVSILSVPARWSGSPMPTL